MNKKSAKIIDEASFRSREFVFKDREHAGKLLAEKLKKYLNGKVLVLAIPSGGVPIGYVISEELEVSLDLVVSRKVPLPYTREAGFGAVTWENIVMLNEALIAQLSLMEQEVKESISRVEEEVEDRTRELRGERPLPDPEDKTVILTDDGLASGYSMLAAAQFVRRHSPKRIIVTVPTAPTTSIELLLPLVDVIECLNIRDSFYFAVADAYVEWHDLTEKEVKDYLRKSRFFLK